VLCTSRRAFDLQEVNAARRVLIPNAIDTHLFCPRRKKAGGQVRIIRVCRPIRCAEYFWAAIHQVLESAPEAEVKLVGGPPFRLGRIESLGDRHDVHHLLAEADIFAYAPWPHEGTLDLVVLEAMASGLPCVLSDAPCVRDSMESGQTGFFTPFGNAEAFAEAILRLVRDAALRERMGRQAAKVAQERFDLRQRVSLYEKAYQEARAADRAAVLLDGASPLAVVA
jgi:glycosyltransferase involved in cell wall biosynthesis